MLGLVAALLVNGQMPMPPLLVGLADGLGGLAPPIFSERRADSAAEDVWAYELAADGLAGGLLLLNCIELGREGVARGMISRGSDEDAV